MPECNSCNGLITEREARSRLTPSLSGSSAPLLSLRHSPRTGFGVFATCFISENTQLLESGGPAVYVIYRAFRKEVCAWCFRYEHGLIWKFRLGREDGSTSGSGAGTGSGGLVFCCEECREGWKGEYGDLGVEAYATVEAFVQKQARGRGWASEDPEEDDDKDPSEQDIQQAWKHAEEQASFIRALRLVSASGALSAKPPDPTSLSNPNSSLKVSKSQKQALAHALSLPVLNTDTLFFLLSGILYASSPHWPTLLTLNPSPAAVYTSMAALRQTTTSFLHLIATLPPSLVPYVTRATIEAVLARDIGNSFGIWSTKVESKSKQKARHEGDEDPEMLGYGIWPVASFFNHSCIPNVSRCRIGRRWVFTSAGTVSEGEELCISYIRGEEDVLHLEDRWRRLRDAWGFTCQCQKCLHEEADARQDN